MSEQGERGARGVRGVQGLQGERGEKGILKGSDIRLLWLYLLTVSLFIILATFVYSNQQRIKHNSESLCRQAKINTMKINSTNRAFVAFLKAQKPQTPATIGFAQLYNNALLTVPVC